MTTQRQPFSRRNTGNVAAAQIRSAERRKCPECGRKGALLRTNLPDDVLVACRFCKYAAMKESE